MIADKVSTINNRTNFHAQSNKLQLHYHENFVFDNMPKEFISKGSTLDEQIANSIAQIQRLRNEYGK